MRTKAIAAALTAILSIALFTVTGTCAEAEPKTVELNSGAARDADFIAVNEEFTTVDGQTLKLVMTGLKPGNVVPGDATPGDTAPGEVRPNEITPSEVNSNDAQTHAVSSVETGDDSPAGLMMLLALLSLCVIVALTASSSDALKI